MTDYVVSPSRLQECPEAPPQYTEHGILVKGTLNAFVGASQSGKSQFLLHLFCCIATGKYFFGIRTHPCRMAIVVGEGFHGIPARVIAWCEYHGVDIAELDERLVFIRVPLDISNDAMVERVLAEVNALGFKIDVIAFDTLSSCAPHGFDDSSNAHMKGYMDLARALRDRHEWTIIFLAHTGHANGPAAKRARGASDLYASMDTELLIENQDGVRTVTMTKSRDFAPMEPLRFKLEPCRQSVVVVPIESPAGPNGEMVEEVHPSMRLALQVLREHGEPMPLSIWKQRCVGNISRAGFYNTRRRLEVAGLVVIDKRGAVLTSGGEAVLGFNPHDSGMSNGRPLDIQQTGRVSSPSTTPLGVDGLDSRRQSNGAVGRPVDTRAEGPGLQPYDWAPLNPVE